MVRKVEFYRGLNVYITLKVGFTLNESLGYVPAEDEDSFQ